MTFAASKGLWSHEQTWQISNHTLTRIPTEQQPLRWMGMLTDDFFHIVWLTFLGRSGQRRKERESERLRKSKGEYSWGGYCIQLWTEVYFSMVQGRESECEICPWNDLNAPLDIHIPHRHIIQLSAQFSAEAISSFCWRSWMWVRDWVRDGKSERWKENISRRFIVI